MEESWEIVSGKMPITKKTEYKILFNEVTFRPWKYNEIIGYIELRKLKDKIYAFVFFPKAERFQAIMNKKIFKLQTDFPNYEIDTLNKSNIEIIREIRAILAQINGISRRLKKYYIDNEIFDNISRFIDFQKI